LINILASRVSGYFVGLYAVTLKYAFSFKIAMLLSVEYMLGTMKAEGNLTLLDILNVHAGGKMKNTIMPKVIQTTIIKTTATMGFNLNNPFSEFSYLGFKYLS
jgi:hypothetical protein